MRLTETVAYVEMPKNLKEAISEAAWKERVSASELIRRTMAERLSFPYIPQGES